MDLEKAESAPRAMGERRLRLFFYFAQRYVEGLTGSENEPSTETERKTKQKLRAGQKRPGIFMPITPGRPPVRSFTCLESSSSTRRLASFTAARISSCSIS